MSDDQDHVEVELEAPKTEEKEEIQVEVETKPEKKAAKAEKAPEVAPEEGIQELKKKLEQEKRRAEEAERRAAQAKQQVNKAYSDVKESNYQLISNALDTAKSRGEILKTAYAEALSVGDHAKVAEIQEAMAENVSNINELKRGKKELKKQRGAEEAQKIEPMQRNIDPVEQMAQSVSARSASWLRENKDNLRDERSIRKMFRAHEDAVDDGIEPDTDAYFNFIESRLGISHEVAPDPVSTASAPAQKRSAPPPAAPVSRGGQRPNVVRLTREQAETARMMGMTEADYARNMLALREEGKIGH